MKAIATLLARGCCLSLAASTQAWHLPDANPAPFWSKQYNQQHQHQQQQQQQPLGAIPNHVGAAAAAAADDDIDITTDSQFHGLRTFANLPYVNALVNKEAEAEGNSYDIAILGAPFDTATSGRPGARFGPAGIRTGSQRMFPGSVSVYTGESTLDQWAKVVDVGDVLLTWFDNSVALRQLDKAHRVISGRLAANTSVSKTPRILTLGGDHTTTLSALRSTAEKWGDVSVIHFDSHIDTWDPSVLGGGLSDYAGINHGTFLHIAHEEGLIKNTSIHAGIRAPVMRPKEDLRNDARCGFQLITARAIDQVGSAGVIEQIKNRVGSSNVYISVDIDVLDPAYAPEKTCMREEKTISDCRQPTHLATGTAEPGGWTSRELLTILDGLSGLKVIGGDVVEVAPIYDNPGETTVLAAAEVALSLLRLMEDTPVVSKADRG